MTTMSLQFRLDNVPDLVDYFYNDTVAPHFSRAGTKSAELVPPASTNWRDEQLAWDETAVLFEQSHHMPELFLTGPDTSQLRERLGVNNFANFTADRAKQFIVCNRHGQVIGDCIAYRHGDNAFELVSGTPTLNWVHFHAETGGYNVTVVPDDHTTANLTGRRVKWRFQLEGPNTDPCNRKSSTVFRRRSTYEAETGWQPMNSHVLGLAMSRLRAWLLPEHADRQVVDENPRPVWGGFAHKRFAVVDSIVHDRAD
jgi:hypothetical protein